MIQFLQVQVLVAIPNKKPSCR